MRLSPSSLLLALAVSVASVGQACAHAHLVSATPQPQGTVTTPPTEVTINFTEELEEKLSSIKVETSSGEDVDKGDSHLDPKDAKAMIVDLKPLTPGTYKVIWKATATDTHKTHGSYTFKVTGG
jgi:methionine-rich copper-binding protein CopC